MDNYAYLNDFLVNLFKNILYYEEHALSTGGFEALSINDWHVIEAIGTGEPQSMSQVARKLSVTVGSLTAAINGLHRKGYVERRHGERDRRVVYISLTEAGRAAFAHHAQYHREMIEAIIGDQTPEQMEALVKSLSRLMVFFKSFGQKQETSEEKVQ